MVKICKSDAIHNHMVLAACTVNRSNENHYASGIFSNVLWHGHRFVKLEKDSSFIVKALFNICTKIGIIKTEESQIYQNIKKDSEDEYMKCSGYPETAREIDEQIKKITDLAASNATRIIDNTTRISDLNAQLRVVKVQLAAQVAANGNLEDLCQKAAIEIANYKEAHFLLQGKVDHYGPLLDKHSIDRDTGEMLELYKQNIALEYNSKNKSV